MALTARPVFCELKPQTQKAEPAIFTPVQKLRVSEPGQLENGKIMLQPRLTTLRSFGSDPVGVIKTKNGFHGENDEVSPFFATLSEYIESSKKSQDFEIISGRLAMIVFAATVSMEVVTGNSLFRKTDFQGIAEAAGVSIGAVACAAIFAWFSSSRSKVGRIFTVGCNTFIDSLIDQIVDGLFYDNELSDWTDDI
ncbi:stress enhanced protein 2, chloroplastic [Nicotiana tomentosiformis]|uniref:stress enhanced protein 2, chloroplastic n=1 Tax=Nicotiana tomentosiformis TaxID=4098 RepID=UPI00051B8AA6|nr:stress enhanced protein 2, chloroplastic [Nicotiana tomentosiformis]